MSVYLKTLGCRLNEAELEHWAQQFRSAGYALVTAPEQAALVVINTCAVTTTAVRKSRQAIRQLARRNPQARLVVSGCYATLEPESVAAELGVDLVVTNQDKDQLVERVSRLLEQPGAPVAATEPGSAALFARGRSRAFIKVQDGCRYRCTFCITTVARGDERSRPVSAIIEEINHYAAAGIQEIVLTGVQLAGYGNDQGNDLAQLLAAILDHTDILRIRLGSLEPWGWPPRLLDLFADTRLQPHLHLPLQSGSDRILRRMARRCWRDDFLHLTQQAQAAIPELNITTDIIVGFPGETAADWQQTLDLVEQVDFGHLHIFPFSPRAGTRAAEQTDPVSAETQQARVAELHTLGQRLKRARLSRHIGWTGPVLWETQQHHGRYWGYTPNYLRVAIPLPVSGIRETRLSALDADGEFLHAELTDTTPTRLN